MGHYSMHVATCTYVQCSHVWWPHGVWYMTMKGIGHERHSMGALRWREDRYFLDSEELN